MSKVIVSQNMEPGWSNQRSGRGEPQSPAAPAPAPIADDVTDQAAPPPAAPKPPKAKKPKAAKTKR